MKLRQIEQDSGEAGPFFNYLLGRYLKVGA